MDNPMIKSCILKKKSNDIGYHAPLKAKQQAYEWSRAQDFKRKKPYS